MTLNSKNHERKVQRKQKRLQHLIANDSDIICCDTPTRVNQITPKKRKRKRKIE